MADFGQNAKILKMGTLCKILKMADFFCKILKMADLQKLQKIGNTSPILA